MTKAALQQQLDAARENAVYWEQRCRRVEEERDRLIHERNRPKIGTAVKLSGPCSEQEMMESLGRKG